MRSRALRHQRRRQQRQRRLIDHPRLSPCRRRWFPRLLAFNRGRPRHSCLRPRTMQAHQRLIPSLLPVHLCVHSRKRGRPILRLPSPRLWETLIPEVPPPIHRPQKGCRPTSCRTASCRPTRCPSISCRPTRYLPKRCGPIRGRPTSSRPRPPRRVAQRRSWVSAPRLQSNLWPKHPLGGQGWLWRLGPSGGGPAWAAVYVAGGSAVMVAGRLSWALRWPRPAAGSGL